MKDHRNEDGAGVVPTTVSSVDDIADDFYSVLQEAIEGIALRSRGGIWDMEVPGADESQCVRLMALCSLATHTLERLKVIEGEEAVERMRRKGLLHRKDATTYVAVVKEGA